MPEQIAIIEVMDGAVAVDGKVIRLKPTFDKQNEARIQKRVNDLRQAWASGAYKYKVTKAIVTEEIIYE